MLRGDIVKLDSGSYAVFTEQGSSASQMTAAKWMVVIARIPDKPQTQCPFFPMFKMQDAPKLLKVPKSECPDIWIRPPRHKWPKSRSNIEDPVVPLQRNLYCHPLAGLLWKDNLKKFSCDEDGKKYPMVNAHSSIESKVYSYRCTWTTLEWLEESQTSFFREKMDEIGWSGRTDITSWPCIPGMYTT